MEDKVILVSLKDLQNSGVSCTLAAYLALLNQTLLGIMAREDQAMIHLELDPRTPGYMVFIPENYDPAKKNLVIEGEIVHGRVNTEARDAASRRIIGQAKAPEQQ